MYRHELLTFLAVADEGSFLKAAQVLYTTPASVMHHMNKLEQMVGVKLLERTNQGATLTAAGSSMYQDAKEMIRFADEAVRRAKRLASSEQDTIRIGTSILRPCKILMDLWAGMDDTTVPFQIQIVPFNDDPIALDSVLSSRKSD